MPTTESPSPPPDVHTGVGASARRSARQSTPATSEEASPTTPPADARADTTASAAHTSLTLQLPTIQDVWHARDVIHPHVYHTPLLPSHTIGALSGADVYLKAE